LTSHQGLVIAAMIVVTGASLNNLVMATPVLSAPTTSIATPQPLGSTITFTASATDTDSGIISYRYEIGGAGSSTLSMARDFSVDPSFVFTPTEHPGLYQIVVTARNNSTLNTGQSPAESFRFTSLIVGNAAVVTPTANPLVALLSSPACPAGATNMRVSVLRSGSTPFFTAWKPCQAGETLNFLVAGMRAATTYSLTIQTWNGTSVTNGAALSYTTGTPTVTYPSISVVTPPTAQDSLSDRFLLMSTRQPFPLAIDITGNPVWYYLDPSGIPPTITRPVTGGKILMLANGANSAGTSVTAQQILREIDLGGNIIRETNATRVSEQVSALSGIASDCAIGGTDCLVGAFHHEATPLSNGHTLVLTDEEKIFTDGTQGSSPTNPVDIIGDIIVDLDTNWQVAWYWRSFDYLNANRAAILGETCAGNGTSGGCPPLFLINTGVAQDWLHGNALYYTPSDGSILFSMRHQDWIVKIDYGNETGTSDILWTLGQDGDFTINSTDPYPWFSHQHDPGFLQNGTSTLALFDNGNTRVSPPPLGLGSGHSRGYVLSMDYSNMSVTPVMLADLGFFSEALGTAELLANGDYHFEAGYGIGPPTYAEAIEVFPNSTLSLTMKLHGFPCYRSFRMTDLYTPPDKD
jgi:arylsulfate sulfotransferase